MDIQYNNNDFSILSIALQEGAGAGTARFVAGMQKTGRMAEADDTTVGGVFWIVSETYLKTDG